MLAQGHSVNLYLLQEAARFCGAHTKCSSSIDLRELIEKNLEIHVLMSDAKLRGINAPSAGQGISEGSYESLIELMESCDRVIGIL